MEGFRFSLRILVCFVAVLGLTFPIAARAENISSSEKIKTSVQAATQTASEPNLSESVSPTEDKVLATVNGTGITQSQVDEQARPQLEQLQAQAAQLPPAFIKQRKQELMRQMLEAMIVERLLAEKVKEKNIVVAEQQVDEQIRQIAAGENLSVDDFKALLEAYGQSLEQIKQRVQKGLAYQQLIMSEAGAALDVNQADARRIYQENIDSFKRPEQVRASHILIKTEAADSNETKAQAKAKAEQLLEQIGQGADFAALAKEHSGCPSGASGGDLGFFGKGQMVPPFEEAVYKLKPGQLSGIVETRFGYHIIKLTDSKEAGIVQFEEAKSDIIEKLKEQKQAEFVKGYIELLRSKASIVYAAIEVPGPAGQITNTKAAAEQIAEQDKSTAAEPNAADVK